MSKVFKYLGKRWYFLLLGAAAIIIQCFLQLKLPETMGEIQNIITAQGTTQEILVKGGWMMLISTGIIALAFIQFYCASYLSSYVGKMLRRDMFHKVNSLSISDYNQFGTGTLITRTTNDIEQIKSFVLMAVRILVMSPTMMIIAIIKISQEYTKLLLPLGVALPIILAAVIILLLVTSPYFKKIQEKVDNYTIVLRESLTGIRVIRAYDQEPTEYGKFDYANKDATKLNVTVNKIMSFGMPFVNVVFNLCFVGIYALGFYLIDGGPAAAAQNQVTSIVVVSQYSMQIMTMFVMFAMVFVMMPRAIASAKRVNEVLSVDDNKGDELALSSFEHFDEYEKQLKDYYAQEESLLQKVKDEYKEQFHEEFNYQLVKYHVGTKSEQELKHDPQKKILDEYDKIHNEFHQKRKKVRKIFKEFTEEHPESQHVEKTNEVKGQIEFKNVTFTYPDTDVPCVKNISFKTKPGTTTAIIGSTGSGKSTIINLIPRFYTVTDGEILLDNVNVNNYNEKDLRDRLGFVPQTALLFKGTIRSNLQFGKSDATDDEMNKALEVAQAKHFVSKLPQGLDTFVSQSGKNFSGGQKQRLCIARALVRKPEIYVFDDSFSALDFKTDAKLRHALKSYTENASVIVVAQRVSSILDADNIIVLNDGEIVGQGKHDELLLNCKVYQDIVKSQLDADEIEKTIKMHQEALMGGEEDEQ